MKQMIEFSVALCTFQGERYLLEQLRSIADQTVPPAEIVIRDDGSTDQTLAICRAFATQIQIPVRILPSDQRLGVAGNFFTCARACRLGWIVFADQDDLWLPDRLAQFSVAIEAHPHATAILSDGQIVDESLQPTGQQLWSSHFFSRSEQAMVQQGRAEAVLARHVFVTGSALAIQRDWLATLPEPAEEFYHDEWIGWFAGPDLRLLPEATFQYRQHGGQQTGVHTTLRAKWEHLKASQRESRQLLLRDTRRFDRLAEQLDRSGYPERAALVRGKLDFVAWRLSLSRHFLIRLPQVLSRIMSGQYARYSILRRSVIKDLFI